MTEREELKPCPFCGQTVHYAEWVPNSNDDGGGRGVVSCGTCPVEMCGDDPGWMNNQKDRNESVSQAIAAWNRRDEG